ncbi:hypothetical protein CSUB01_10023 [Colletotrichum sublineola]|uniref:Uncharacterized protein n=1 Tax=Colletotrichum sublineola TaxID=1173701 RepID=A0A066XTE2_COLSU|nr:hypothetical protein CSUB01_10023 [Colletotrichum sublineola]
MCSPLPNLSLRTTPSTYSRHDNAKRHASQLSKLGSPPSRRSRIPYIASERGAPSSILHNGLFVRSTASGFTPTSRWTDLPQCPHPSPAWGSLVSRQRAMKANGFAAAVIAACPFKINLTTQS